MKSRQVKHPCGQCQLASLVESTGKCTSGKTNVTEAVRHSTRTHNPHGSTISIARTSSTQTQVCSQRTNARGAASFLQPHLLLQNVNGKHNASAVTILCLQELVQRPCYFPSECDWGMYSCHIDRNAVHPLCTLNTVAPSAQPEMTLSKASGQHMSSAVGEVSWLCVPHSTGWMQCPTSKRDRAQESADSHSNANSTQFMVPLEHWLTPDISQSNALVCA